MMKTVEKQPEAKHDETLGEAAKRSGAGQKDGKQKSDFKATKTDIGKFVSLGKLTDLAHKVSDLLKHFPTQRNNNAHRR